MDHPPDVRATLAANGPAVNSPQRSKASITSLEPIPTKNPPYSNSIAIAKGGEIYQLSSSGTPKLKGIGLRSGDWFVSNWGYNNNFGVMIYELDQDTAMGRWTRPGSDQVGVEKLLKIC